MESSSQQAVALAVADSQATQPVPVSPSVNVSVTDTNQAAPAVSRPASKTPATVSSASSSAASQPGAVAEKDDAAGDISTASAEADTKPSKSLSSEPVAQKQSVSEAVPVSGFSERAAASQAAAAVSAVSASAAAGTAVSQHGSGVSSAEQVAANPYQRLDQAGSSSAPVLLHANANRVSVGIHDPSLGWVEVKTQSIAGQVSASLVASTSQTHESLSAQLPSLTQFLSDRSVTVGSVTVQQGTSGGEMSSGGGQRQEQGANQQSSGASAAETPDTLLETSDVVPEARPLSYISVRA